MEQLKGAGYHRIILLEKHNSVVSAQVEVL